MPRDASAEPPRRGPRPPCPPPRYQGLKLNILNVPPSLFEATGSRPFAPFASGGGRGEAGLAARGARAMGSPRGGPTPRTPLPPPGGARGPDVLPGGRAGGGGGGSLVAVDVLRLLLELQHSHGLSTRACFDHFDSDGDGAWDRAEIYELVRALAPTLPVKGRFAVIDALAGLDPEGAGRVTYQSFKMALRLLGAPVSPTAARAPRPSLSKEAIIGGLSNLSKERADGGGGACEEGDVPASAQRPHSSRALQKKSSSILLADALCEANISGESKGRGEGGQAPCAKEDGIPRTEIPAPHATPSTAAPLGRQPFLATSSCDLSLMVQEDLGTFESLQDVFDAVYSDTAKFYELNKCDADIEISVSEWADSQVHSGAVRAVRMKTMHCNLGLLSTLDLQRHAWGPGRRWLAVEHRTVTPTLPHGDKWRVEKRCTFSVVPDPVDGGGRGVVQAVIAAAVHVAQDFPQSTDLKRAVERTLAEDARVYLHAVRDTLSNTDRPGRG